MTLLFGAWLVAGLFALAVCMALVSNRGRPVFSYHAGRSGDRTYNLRKSSNLGIGSAAQKEAAQPATMSS